MKDNDLNKFKSKGRPRPSPLKYIISGTSSPTLTMTVSGQYYKKQSKDVKILVYITNPDTQTTTTSSYVTVTFVDNTSN